MTAGTAVATGPQCKATIRHSADEFGFVPVFCGQRVGVRTFVETSGQTVGYCPIEGHEANVRRKYAERPAEGEERAR